MVHILPEKSINFVSLKQFIIKKTFIRQRRHLKLLFSSILSLRSLILYSLHFQLERGELTLFLSAYTEAVTDHVLLIEEGVREVLQKYMSVLTPCILSMY